MERRARRRQLTLVVLLLAACGGGGAQTRPAEHASAAVAADAGPAASAADAAPLDRCGGYAVAVAPVLGRIARNAEAFLEQLSTAKQAAQVVRAAESLAASLEGERPALDAIRTQVVELDAAHVRLAQALTGLAQAVRELGLSYSDASFVAARDSASANLNAAIREWAESVQGIQVVCPGLQ